MAEIIPLFPLHTVLFPGGELALKIFEARYIDMVSECLRQESGFGVCLIRQGHEVGQAAVTESVGTYAVITDFQQYPDGLLGITAKGRQRFYLNDSHTQPDNLLRGAITWIANEPPSPAPARFLALRDLFLQLAAQAGIPAPEANEVADDAVRLGYRLAELLPMALPDRQLLLEITEPLQRLDRLLDWFSQADKDLRLV